MPYVLVLLQEGRNIQDEQLHTVAHEQFISSLIRRNRVLLGGGFAGGDDVHAGYVLRCGDARCAWNGSSSRSIPRRSMLRA
jgi:hypothetical protein